MKRYIHLLFYPLTFLIFIGCASTVPPEFISTELIVQRVIPVQGSQTQIYDSSIVWLAKAIGSVEEPLEYRNTETGEVIRNAYLTYQPDIKISPTIVYFSINIQAKDNKSRITIDKIKTSWGKMLKNEAEEIKALLESVIDDYEDYIISRSHDEW